MSPMGHVSDPAAEVVERRLEEGWRPSQLTERTWLRGGRPVIEDPDDDVAAEPYDETEPMTTAEEQALIHRVYQEPDAGGLEPVVVEWNYMPGA
jgi:hypothetical protein